MPPLPLGLLPLCRSRSMRCRSSSDSSRIVSILSKFRCVSLPLVVSRYRCSRSERFRSRSMRCQSSSASLRISSFICLSLRFHSAFPILELGFCISISICSARVASWIAFLLALPSCIAIASLKSIVGKRAAQATTLIANAAGLVPNVWDECMGCGWIRRGKWMCGWLCYG